MLAGLNNLANRKGVDRIGRDNHFSYICAVYGKSDIICFLTLLLTTRYNNPHAVALFWLPEPKRFKLSMCSDCKIIGTGFLGRKGYHFM